LADSPTVLTPAQVDFLSINIPGFSGKWQVSVAAGAGSERKFIRIVSPSDPALTYILIVWNSQDKDWTRFVAIQRELGGALPYLPKVFAADEKRGLILEEDLGGTTLNRFCREHEHDTGKVSAAYRDVIDSLIRWQAVARELSPSLCKRSMDLEMFMWESEYFAAHCVTEYFGLDEMLGSHWERERKTLALATSTYPVVAIHRDFQSENIMLTAGGMRFVDFQGARLGPAGYDLASLLYDPYVAFLDETSVNAMTEYYNGTAPRRLDLQAFHYCAIQRLMQALGAYGNLSLHKGKEWYHAYVPVALRRLAGLLEKCPEFTQLRDVVAACIDRSGKTVRA
jgi:N-acetylmuramate 1-kinase